MLKILQFLTTVFIKHRLNHTVDNIFVRLKKLLISLKTSTKTLTTPTVSQRK